LKYGLIRGVAIGGNGLIRGVAFGGNGLIRGVAFGGSGLIRGVAFGGNGLIRLRDYCILFIKDLGYYCLFPFSAIS
jgi:hypothetical protein